MQLALRTVWHRFMWSSLPIFEEIVIETCRDKIDESSARAVGQQTSACSRSPGQDDAFDTIMQWLAAKALA